MARFTNGWVKMNREFLDDRWNGNKRSILMLLNLMANYQDGSPTIRKGQRFVLLKGQVMTSLNELSRMLEIAKSTVHRNLEFLKEMGEIWYTSDTLGTVITLVNYSDNRDIENSVGHERDTLATTGEYTREYRIEEVKKLRIKEGGGEAATATDLEKFLFSYEQAFLTKHTYAPIVNRAGRAAAKRVISDIGLEKACSLVEGYLKIRHDPFFHAKAFDLVTFEAHIGVVEKFCQSGKHLTLLELREREKESLRLPKL